MNKHDNVIKEFFKNYRGLFLELKGSLEEILKKDKNVREEFEEKNISTIDFLKSYLNRLFLFIFYRRRVGLVFKGLQNGGRGLGTFYISCLIGKWFLMIIF